jgi:hypothetical protein
MSDMRFRANKVFSYSDDCCWAVLYYDSRWPGVPSPARMCHFTYFNTEVHYEAHLQSRQIEYCASAQFFDSAARILPW